LVIIIQILFDINAVDVCDSTSRNPYSLCLIIHHGNSGIFYLRAFNIYAVDVGNATAIVGFY